MMVARYTASFAPAAAVTFGLLLWMQLMIATGTGARTESHAFRIREFVRVERPPDVPAEEHRPERIPEPPVPPGRTEPDLGEGLGPAIEIRNPERPPIAGPGRSEFGLVDGDLMPIVKVLPQYPAAAIRQDLEGYVIVTFTVTRTGAVTDVKVEEASMPVFERAAIDAAYKFRYRPRVINGEAVEVLGVRNRFNFELDR
jgi:protein TonB